MKIAILASLALSAEIAGTPFQAGPQPAAAPEEQKPNIAVSGCLMRQGYATFIVADAQVDATGPNADKAPARTGGPPSDTKTPQRWILDNAGVVGQHVGEKVQVTGVSDWVARSESAGGAAPEASVPGASIPHIDVKVVKVLAKTCS